MKNSPKLTYSFLFCSLLLVGEAAAQSLTPRVTATSGAVFSTEALSVEWTLGEIMTETYAGGTVLTQGFHQPGLGLLSSTNDAPNLAGYGVRVYPNPATDRISVRLPAGARLLGLRNVTGRGTAIRFRGSADQLTANVSALPAGVYFLLVQLAGGRMVTNRLTIH